MYFSFTPSEAQEFNRQLKLPKGGAVISVVALDRFQGLGFRTLDEWAVADAKGVSAGPPFTHSFDVPADSRVTAAIISVYDSATFGPDDQSEHRVNVFLEFRQKFFAAHLMYQTHDAKGSAFEKVFLDTIRSIRPIEGAKNK